MHFPLTSTPEIAQHYQRFTTGNEASFSWLLAHFRPAMQRAAFYYVKDTQAANSILQETNLLAWQRRHRMEGYAHLYRFMRLALKWRCYQWLKAYRKQNCFIHAGISTTLENQLAHATTIHPTEEAAYSQQQWQQVFAAINHLPPRLKKIMQLYFLHNLSSVKISRRLHLPVHTVREEIKQSIKLLRKSVLGHPLPVAAPLAIHAVDNRVTQQVLTLRMQQSLSFQQIAVQLHLSQSQVLQHYLSATRSTTINLTP